MTFSFLNLCFVTRGHKICLSGLCTDCERANILAKCVILPAKAREYVFTGVGLCVCLSVTSITKTIVDGFVPNFTGMFIGALNQFERSISALGCRVG